MLSLQQLNQIANKLIIADSVVLREYCQLVLLSSLVINPKAEYFIFKGGTAIRFIYGGQRFSEDLDFTVNNLHPDEAGQIIEAIISGVTDAGNRILKPIKTIVGKSYRLTWLTPLQSHPIYIKIDLSFGEETLEVINSPIMSNYPVITQSHIYHLTKKEMVAEKVRAILNRQKGRDLYDLWYMLSMQTEFDLKLIERKLKYYQKTFDRNSLLIRINSFPKDKFVADLSTFVGKAERDRLPALHGYIQDYLTQKLKS